MPTVDVRRSNNKTMIAVDFMAYARRVQVTKLKLATYGDFFHNYGARLAICLGTAAELISYSTCIFQKVSRNMNAIVEANLMQ